MSKSEVCLPFIATLFPLNSYSFIEALMFYFEALSASTFYCYFIIRY